MGRPAKACPMPSQIPLEGFTASTVLSLDAADDVRHAVRQGRVDGVLGDVPWAP